ncbi:predicted protein [Histoplasma mississippiense (nom. inval.)]|uniref:predicted protein n=1 Tax=Ajellomyces capsulatus (strain NAm1 / WU24) TaxID=2059318 RepID=UPI000157B8F2|nr:predicted protein [Histoplasma mississippiense (nom. inval.)]EDN03760.1 predicted protein [Histoplasma mississippiense (nom. inval.)]
MAPTIQNLAQNEPMAPDVQSDSPQARQISDKKRPKWSPEEDVLIIELRQRGMAWGDISKELPGRSALSCRLHYQNYLERRSEWSEDRKTKSKSQMWAKIAEEMSIPWRAVEAMHWQLGEQEMARRARTVPFLFSQPASKPPRVSRSRPVRLPPFAELDAASQTYGSDLPNSTEWNRRHADTLPTMGRPSTGDWTWRA